MKKGHYKLIMLEDEGFEITVGYFTGTYFLLIGGDKRYRIKDIFKVEDFLF